MHIKRSIFIILVLLIISIELKAQFTGITSDAITKYWFYRWRLNDFVKVGDQQGESIPFAERNSYNNQDLNSGDGTQKLGMYQCLLATEYL